MEGKDKVKFRNKKVWKDFRLTMLIKEDYTCEICKIRKKKGLNIHHMNGDDYTNLDPKYFSVLCSTCHTEVERLLKRKVLDIDNYSRKIKTIFDKSKKKY